jgi:flagellar hook-associated protein 3 FlgL
MIYATSLLARSSTAVTNVKSAQQRVLQAQYDIASGTSVNVGSDDPVAASLALRLQASQERLANYTSNIDTATSRQTAMDSALQNISELFSQASSIAVSGSSAATTSSDMLAALAAEVESLQSRLGALANSEIGGNYLFGGTATNQPPFVIDGDDVTYRGSSDSQTMAISNTLTTTTTLAGSTVFLSPVNAFDTLADLKAALTAGDTDAVSASLDRIGEVSSVIYKALTTVGAASAESESIHSILSSQAIDIESSRSTAADTDMAEASIRLSAANVAYEAALEVASRLAKPTLLDFL